MLPMMYASVVAGIRKVCNVKNPESESKSKQDIKKVGLCMILCLKFILGSRVPKYMPNGTNIDVPGPEVKTLGPHLAT